MAEDKKRATPRYIAKSGTHIVYLEGSGAIRDMSLDGMYVLDPDPLPIGTTITFALRMGTFDVQLQGKVTRSEPERGMVIQFTELTREAIRRLKIHIADLTPSPVTPKKL